MNIKICILKILVLLIIFVTDFFLTVKPIYSQTTPSSPVIPKDQASDIDREIEMLKELFKILFSFSPSQSSPPSQTFSSLREIFRGQTEVPPLILEAVMQIEMPSIFNLTSDQVKEYSTSGKTIPGCAPNICSATGPMQMTIGVDNTGNSLCPNCCWKGVCLDTKGGCPNAWASYGSGDPCNLKDNVYAAARKLRKDSGAGSSVNWTQDQVYQASRRYYGDCTVAYSRLGNRTYCEYVWWYYTTN